MDIMYMEIWQYAHVKGVVILVIMDIMYMMSANP